MSLKNLLDLRENNVQIIEKTVFEKRPWYQELAKTFFIILASSAIIWGISKADTAISSPVKQTPLKSFSAIGVVSNITDGTLSLLDGKSSEQILDISNVSKIETKDYHPLSISDIKIGDKIIVQGALVSNGIEVRRIISFGPSPVNLVATSTTLASTTATSTDATSTSIIDTVTNAVSNVVDVVKDTTQNIIDSITGTSTSTTTDEATTTEATPTPPADSSSTPEATPEPDATQAPNTTDTPQAPPADASSTN